jgi:hypothetical protein
MYPRTMPRTAVDGRHARLSRLGSGWARSSTYYMPLNKGREVGEDRPAADRYPRALILYGVLRHR